MQLKRLQASYLLYKVQHLLLITGTLFGAKTPTASHQGYFCGFCNLNTQSYHALHKVGLLASSAKTKCQQIQRLTSLGLITSLEVATRPSSCIEQLEYTVAILIR